MANRFAAERGLVFQFNKDELIQWGVTTILAFSLSARTALEKCISPERI
jgi:hypothetical protein